MGYRKVGYISVVYDLSYIILRDRDAGLLLWEQEIGSSNLPTPTLENAKYLSTKALLLSGAFTFNNYQSLSFIPINGTKKTGQLGAFRDLGPIYS